MGEKKKKNFPQHQGNSDLEAFHRIPVSITSATWKRTLQTVIKKKKKKQILIGMK